MKLDCQESLHHWAIELDLSCLLSMWPHDSFIHGYLLTQFQQEKWEVPLP